MKKFLTFVALLMPLASIASGFDDMARAIAMRNPELESVKASYDAELLSAKADNILGGPEVGFDYKFNADGGENRWGLSVGQAFDWPGLYRARGKAREYRADAFRLLYQASFVERALEAKQALLSLAVAEKQLAVLRDADLAMSRLAETYEYAFSQGETTILETTKIRLQRFEIANRLAGLEAQAESIRATLRALNGGEDIDALPVFDSRVHLKPMSFYSEQLEACDPTVAANQSLDLAYGQDVRAARASSLPGFKIAYTHDYEDGTHFNGFSIGVNLPSWSGKARTKAAVASAEASRLAANDYAMRQHARLVNDYSIASRLDARVDAARATFENDEYPKVLRKAFDGKRITALEYLREYADYLDAKTAFIELEGQLADAMASLERYDLLTDK